MADVFISFIHEEEAVAKAVQDILKHHLGTKAFMSADDWQIFAGEIWLERIKGELEEAKVLLLMLSEASVARPWINFEAGAAWLTGKAIVPVCFKGLVKSTLPKPYSSIQALDIPDDAYYLVRSVSHHLGKGPPPEPFPLDGPEERMLAEAIDKGQYEGYPPRPPPGSGRTG